MFVFGVIFALVAGILFGLIGPTTKIAYNAGASVPIAIFLRYAVATIIILPFLPYQKNLFDVFKKNLKYFISISVGSIFLTLGLLTSVKFIEVSLTILIFCLYPIYVLIYSIIVDKEKILLSVKILFLITFIGIIMVLGPSFKVINLLGVTLAIVASLGATSMIIINQKMSSKGISPIPINIFINMFNVIFFFIVLKIFFSLDFDFPINIFLLILIPSICYSFALLSQLIAIPKIGQSYTALFLYLEPVVGVLGAVFLLKENLQIYQIVGAVIVIISLLSASYITSKN
tara:strand:+ start:1106 stop:1969 length:864 start_codon:yes stop_codon:yes gene_type:complete